MSLKTKFYLLGMIIIFNLFINIQYLYAQQINFTLDFEEGNLRGWIPTGNAFIHQPTLDDNPTARHRGQPSKHQGRYWIGTYEKYQGQQRQKPGDIQGDEPQGTLTSAPFTIPHGKMSFLVGGGSSFKTRVEFLVHDPIEGDIRAFYVSGQNTETMQRVTRDLTPYAGKIGKIRIVDKSSEPWGHVNVDDFIFTSSPAHVIPVIPVFPVDEKVEVPNLLTLHINEAKGILRDFRLNVGEITKRASDREAGTVLRQKPVAGTRVSVGTPVNIEIAVREMVEVPNMVGKDIGQAREMLEETRLRLGTVSEGNSNRSAGIIFQQEPTAGTKIVVDSPVNLWITVERERPMARIRPEHLRVTQGEGVVFESLSIPEGEIRERWSGPDDQRGTGRHFEIRTDQLSPGSYDIILTIMDNYEQTDEAVAMLEIIPQVVETGDEEIHFELILEGEPDHAAPGQPVVFRAYIEPYSEIAEYQFIFGDGSMRDWSHESTAENRYSESGDYHAHVIARIDTESVESNTVTIQIIPESRAQDSNDMKWVLIIAGIIAGVGGCYLFSRITRYKKKPIDTSQGIQIRPHKDFGIQYLEPETSIQTDLEIRLIKVFDKGKQEIEGADTLIIDERR
jgi:hypothetical protein